MQIGIVGAGTLGTQIAIVFAKNKKFDVLLSSRNIESANKGMTKIDKYLSSRVEKGKMTDAEMLDIKSRITISEIEKLSDCDLVIEAIAEDFNQKREIFKTLDKVCRKECVFSSNTSSLSIKKLSDGLSRKVIGTHFFNPAVVMKLVELVYFDDSQLTDINKIEGIIKEIGKEPVIVKDSAGFIVNRLMIPYINEAIELLRMNVASREDIDTAMKLGANYPMGALELADMIGLDVVLSIMYTFQNEIDKDRYRPSKLLVQMVKDGKLGRKVKEGFYNYEGS